jgi:nucleoid-associated protein YgaU
LASNNKLDTSIVSRPFNFSPISSAPIGQYDSPRARLRNEAPRPVGVDPQSPAAIRRVPSENVETADPYKVSASKESPAWSAPQLLNAGYSESAQSPPTALPASYAAPVNSVSENQFAPPPWPVPDEVAEPRTHVVVDGDSLERLAGRYLSDPRRSREIYELNREVLSAPDLLPIGAELKIPERTAAASSDRHGFQPNSASVTQNREVGRENMTPVHPASAPQGIIPRAQLAPPLMVQ